MWLDSVSRDERASAITTWRYLRVAMVVLAIGLGFAVVYERLHTPVDCWQTSISAYYYTPVQGVFVAALVGIGVCLFCLKGSTDIEDALLNLAGMCAPMVAFVPTPHPGACRVVADVEPDLAPSIATNVTTLLVAVSIGLGIIALTAVWKPRPPEPQPLIGYVAAVVVWGLFALFFVLEREAFTSGAHNAAAVSMFLCICAVALLNAFGLRGDARARRFRASYILVGALMFLSVVAVLVAARGDWDHGLIVIEALLIAEFAIFWLIQTWELWAKGLRSPRDSDEPAAPASGPQQVDS